MGITINNQPATKEELSQRIEEVNKGNKIIEEYMQDLTKIVEQLKKGNFKSESYELENNIAFISLEKLAKLQQEGELIKWLTEKSLKS